MQYWEDIGNRLTWLISTIIDRNRKTIVKENRLYSISSQKCFYTLKKIDNRYLFFYPSK